MAQIRQPKFKVNNYKLLRKSYVLAVIQKLKPLISERYTQYLAEESARAKVFDDIDMPQNGALLQKQRENIEHLIAATIEPFKPFWHTRSGQGSSPCVPLIAETIRDATLADSSREPSDNNNQTSARSSTGTADLNEIFSKNYITDTPSTSLSNSVQDFISADNLLPLAKYVEVQGASQTAHRNEIDVTQLEGLLTPPIYSKYLNAMYVNNRAEPTPVIELSDQLPDENFERSDNISSNLMDGAATNEFVEPQSWFRSAQNILEFILTYLVVFCIIGFFFALLP